VPRASKTWAAFSTMVSGATVASAACPGAAGGMSAVARATTARTRADLETRRTIVVMAYSLRAADRSGRVPNREARQRPEPILIRGVRQRTERGERLFGFFAGTTLDILQAPRRLDCGNHRL